MKNILIIGAALFLSACASSGSSKEEPVSEQEEAEIVETITTDLAQAQEELKQETEESLNEIDSLLADF